MESGRICACLLIAYCSGGFISNSAQGREREAEIPVIAAPTAAHTSRVKWQTWLHVGGCYIQQHKVAGQVCNWRCCVYGHCTYTGSSASAGGRLEEEAVGGD